MSKEELKFEINKVLDNFSDKALNELLNILKELNAKSGNVFSKASINKILQEDRELLTRLAQ